MADRTYDVTVRFPQNTRNSPEALGNLVLTTSGGAQIPLSQVAHIKQQTGESTIAHEMNHRVLLVRIDNRDRALSDYLAEAQRKIDQSVNFDHSKYRLEWGGQFENQQRAQARLDVDHGPRAGADAVFLFAEFGKMRQAVLILGVVPLATLGGLIALHLTGETLNVASAVGFIALFGVAVQNGIIMISNINRVREQGSRLREAVLSGAVERFRPVLMTATVATVGMLPAALATGVGTDVQRALATVVVGGLMIATLLTLFILPTYYFALEQWVERRKTDEEATAVRGGMNMYRLTIVLLYLVNWMCGWAGFPAPSCAQCRPLHAATSACADGISRGQGRRGAALRAGYGHSRSMVDAVSFETAQ